ncbi:hypothetical protein GCM10010275_26760 [Streptomyces litmocidini]|nr:hypothetical protein GCM10010275_26760 [Streptomyces litmocidini]
MSGEKDPATRADATSGPRAVPSRRSAGSTAAAWLSVNGNGSSPRVPTVTAAGVRGRPECKPECKRGATLRSVPGTDLVGTRPRGDETVKHGQGPVFGGPELA